MQFKVAAAAVALAAFLPIQAQADWAVLGPALSRHVVQQGDVPDGRHWNERHAAIALQYTEQLATPGWARRYYGQVVVDSFGAAGVLAGASLQREISPDAWPVKIDVGASLNAWQRQVDWQGKRNTVFFPLPVATFTHKASVWGVNTAITPRIERHGELVTPVVLMVQVFKQF